MGKEKLAEGLRKVNVVSHLCHAALGPGHHPAIRYGAACVIMLAGVLIAKVGGAVHAFHIHYIADLIGYGVHGLGAVPFIEKFIELMNPEEHVPEVVWPEIFLEEGEDGGID